MSAKTERFRLIEFTLHSNKAVVAVVVFLLIVCSLAKAAQAQSATVFKMNRSVTISPLGDADIKMELNVPTNLYTMMKTNTPNMSVLLRRIGSGQQWAEMQNVQGRFEDMTSSVKIDATQLGLARVERGGRWVVQAEKKSNIDLITITGNEAIFNEVGNTDFGLTNLVIRVAVPQGATDVKWNDSRKQLSYSFEPNLKVGTDSYIDFDVDAKENVMSNLAKVYSNVNFPDMWAARSVMKNSGDTVLNDFRVRFRIASHSSWSPWHRTAKVYPGQTVVDPFYPVFELDKLAGMTGSRPSMLEIEYQYRTPEGEMVRETDNRRVTMLARNQAVFSSCEPGEVLNFYDAFDMVPAVLASMTTANDPVVQQLAGGVSGMLGGVSASGSDEGAVDFMRALDYFLWMNKVAYQTPPTFLSDTTSGQHIKYARDVLRNRAGTCVDLAVLWASAFEAVGLRSVIVVIPGHAFPAVYLPSGKLVAIESTAIGAEFEDMLQEGMRKLAAAQKSESYIIDIQQMRQMGIESLDLPSVPVNYLQQLGYTFEVPEREEPQPAPQQVQQVDYTPAPAPAPQPNNTVNVSAMVGRWAFANDLEGGRLEIDLVLGGNGRFSIEMTAYPHNEQPVEVKLQGTWHVDGTNIVFQTQEDRYEHSFELESNNLLWIHFPTFEKTLGLERTQ